jgi:hypothetical protein
VVPWSTFWERNYFADRIPPLQDILANDFVRGAVSGLGLVNLMAGLVDLAGVMSVRREVGRAAGPGGDAIGTGLVDGE